MEWKRLKDALEITGHGNVAALQRWVARWNANNPDFLIARRHGYVDAESLRNALHREAITYTPGMAERAAMVRTLIAKRRARGNEHAMNDTSRHLES